MVSIAGLDKSDVLRVLYDNARVQGMGIMHAKDGNMSKAEAEEILKVSGNFDYLHGRVMKVRIDDSGELQERLYDRDNGAGAAERAIADLRTSLAQA